MLFRLFRSKDRLKFGPQAPEPLEATPDDDGAFGLLKVLIIAAAVFGIGGAGVGVYYLASSRIDVPAPARASDAPATPKTGEVTLSPD